MQKVITAVMPTVTDETQRVLVIDDEESVREAVMDILEFAGYSVLTANDGEAGVTLFRCQADKVDLVLLDLSMPGLNGAETLTLLRQIDPEVKVILSSGFDESDISDNFDDQGPAGFLQKPYNMHSLVEVVGAYLE